MAPAYQKTVPVEAGKAWPTPGPRFSRDELARRAVFPSWAQHELGAVESTLVLLTSGKGSRRAATEDLRVPADARGLFPTSRVAALWQWGGGLCWGVPPKAEPGQPSILKGPPHCRGPGSGGL